MKLLSLLLCGLFSVNLLFAQDEPIEFGSVDIAVADGWVAID